MVRIALFALEQALNLPFRIDPEARVGLAALAGRSVRVTLTHPAQSFDLVFGAERVSVRAPAGAPDVVVRGSAWQLAALMRARPEQTQQAAASGLSMEGDIDTAWAMKRLFENAPIDWQEALAGAIGDIPAQIVSRGLRRAGDSVRYAAKRLAANAVVFLQDEGRALPRPWEMEEFLAAVDTLRDDVERLGQRVRRLKTH
ncbi:SCP2 sterol-binding domain-containing protein [Acidiferrobacter sp.]|uniref:ubiquinone biosynthesis accessory factor UbiJ n=1 Tax=Acidiferrobacter sp. TaxID=1872107 RepID=UPI00262FFAB1|nr:SCP2 sterol-binding domain-containing protein [Acidiferrobacter sp.]